jgi:hypothetical protein
VGPSQDAGNGEQENSSNLKLKIDLCRTYVHDREEVIKEAA